MGLWGYFHNNQNTLVGDVCFVLAGIDQYIPTLTSGRIFVDISDVTWASCHLKSPKTEMYVQQHVQENSGGNIKALSYWLTRFKFNTYRFM